MVFGSASTTSPSKATFSSTAIGDHLLSFVSKDSLAAMEVVIVGAGHNALVAAAYLARAGKRVLMLEKRDHAGGAAVSERPFGGEDALLSRYAYLVSLLPAQIARDLGVAVELRTRRVAACAPPDLLAPGRIPEQAAWDAFYAMTDGVAARMFGTMLAPLPSRDEAAALFGREAWRELVEQPLGETLAARFSDPLVRGVVGTDGLIGTFASLYEASLAQNRCFFWHIVGGPWRVPVGGMGAVSGALERAAREAGAEIRTGAEVVRVDGGEVTWIEGGREHAVSAERVLAGVAPPVLDRLRGRAPRETAEGSQTKVNLLLARLPRVKGGISAEDAFAGTFRLHEREDELEAAWAAAARGELPDPAPAELYCHSLTDPSIVPPGRHTLTLFGLHTPASLFRADNQGVRDRLAERYLDQLDALLEEPIRDCLARDADGRPCIEARSPLDLEAELGLPAGNIFHGDLSWPWRAQGGGRWGVETDDERILVCGAGAVRGGGVSGIAGHNAAMAVLGR
jgi:phytoene dehydrogenase-like protein